MTRHSVVVTRHRNGDVRFSGAMTQADAEQAVEAVKTAAVEGDGLRAVWIAPAEWLDWPGHRLVPTNRK